jgi:predicted ATPase/DNA-binding CsgD family transcriptional regulator
MHVVPREESSGEGGGRRYNFPAQVTSLVGRERQIEAACAALSTRHTRLLTVSGPPGVGKTRLAMVVAAEVAGSFADGAYFVPLATISDPGLVVTTIGQALGMKEAGNQALISRLKAFVADKELLLVLDNFEQVMPAAPLLGELLGAAPGLKMLVTSRALLHLYGEHDFRLPPLDLPDLDRSHSLEGIAQNGAVQLFVQRAQAARPDFKLTEANAHDVAEICVLLAGLPLAIELAAARTRLLPPTGILSNLKGQGQRLAFLRGGAHNLPARQQTLRGAIEWSYNLLDEGEKKLLRRLAVFLGSCTIEAIEAVSSPRNDALALDITASGNDAAVPARASLRSQHSADVLDRLTSLVDKSLLRQEETPGGEVRFSMLEMIREYLLEQLEESGEAEELHRRHAFYYARLVEFVQGELLSDACAQQVIYLGLLEREHDNLRAALDWCRYCMSRATAVGDGAGQSAGQDASEIDWQELALNMAGRLWVFWERHGHLNEGFRQMTSLLYYGEPRPTRARATALVGAGRLLMWQDPAAARSYLEEGLKLWRQLGSPWDVSLALLPLGHVLTMIGELEQARVYLEETLAIRRPFGQKMGISSALDSLGRVALRMGDYAEAEKLFKEGLAVGGEVGDISSMAFALHGLGQVAHRHGDFERARTYYVQSIELRHELGDRRGVADSLVSLVDALAAQGAYTQAARLSGLAEAVCEAIGVGLHLSDRIEHDRSVAELRNQLGREQFSRLWAEGRHLSVEQAIEIEHAPGPHEGDDPIESTAVTAGADDLGLTPRELEVLRMIAMGMTNVQAASTLSISPHTVNMHVRSIFTKLGVTSRSAATRYAIVNRLV